MQLIEHGQVVIPTGPMIKGSRPFYWILLKEANLLVNWPRIFNHIQGIDKSQAQRRHDSEANSEINSSVTSLNNDVEAVKIRKRKQNVYFLAIHSLSGSNLVF